MKIELNTELDIGTEFWFMYENKPSLGIVAEIYINITTCTEKNKGWREQLFSRWIKGKAKGIYRTSYQYFAKFDRMIERWSIEKKGDHWYLSDRRLFWSEEELLKSLSTNAPKA